MLNTERGYFRTNAERMQYPTYREQGLPIGSGAVESAAKHLVQQRMKRAGMRWSELGARAILHLRCALLNGNLLAYGWPESPMHAHASGCIHPCLLAARSRPKPRAIQPRAHPASRTC